MRKLESILLAVDFRPSSREAARVAVDLAAPFAASVTALNVLRTDPSWPAEMHLEKQWANRELDELMGPHAAATNVSWTGAIAMGAPVDTIIRHAQAANADLVLIGAGELPPAAPFRAGPIAEAIVQHASQPVLAIRPGGSVHNFRRILCPVDHSAVSRQGLEHAIWLAQAFDGTLTVLTVAPAVTWLSAAVETGGLRHAQEQHDEHWRAEFDAFLKGVEWRGVRWRREVRSGSPAREIAAAAREQQADLLVMGCTGRTGLARVLLGSVTRGVLDELPCSLLAVKDETLKDSHFEADLDFLNLLMAEAKELLQTGCFAQAASKFNHVLARHPYHVEALDGLAEARAKLHQTASADQVRRRADRLRRQFGALVPR